MAAVGFGLIGVALNVMKPGQEKQELNGVLRVNWFHYLLAAAVLCLKRAFL